MVGVVALVWATKEPNCTPLLLAWLLTQTAGGAPANKPTPPRSCVVLLPVTSQLKPTHGEISGAVLGFWPTSTWIPSRKVSVVSESFRVKVLPNTGRSTRKP